jgi:translation initiation factor 2 beta subunit (eIF-2beta)/eIF-5
MPKTRNIGICCVKDCGKPERSINLCANHYQLYKKRGSTDKLVRNKQQHPLYNIWWERKSYGSLNDEFCDFWKFVEAIKERPSERHFLVRIDTNKQYSIDNFRWQEFLKRREGESKKDWYARKWKDRQARHPKLESDRSIRRKFGMTRDEYNKKLQEQNGVCAICKQPETTFTNKTGEIKNLSVDHCHKTGKIRELLCFSCNSGIGKVKESIPLLEAMIEYLKKHSQP